MEGWELQITTGTTVKTILDTYPDAGEVFRQHGVEVPLECDESVLDTELAICDSMCHIDDIDALICDLQKFVDAKQG